MSCSLLERYKTKRNAKGFFCLFLQVCRDDKAEEEEADERDNEPCVLDDGDPVLLLLDEGLFGHLGHDGVCPKVSALAHSLCLLDEDSCAEVGVPGSVGANVLVPCGTQSLLNLKEGKVCQAYY